MSRKQKTPASKSIEKITDSNSFRRVLHSKGDLRQGLSLARLQTDPRLFPAIVTELARVPLYLRTFAAEPFPSTYENFKMGKRIARLGLEGEFYWSASILSLFVESLSRFVSLRSNFEKHFLLSDYRRAQDILDEIEKTCGVSIWLIANRLQLLQLREGLNAQKKFLGGLLDIEGISPFPAYLAYYLSGRCEENVTFSAFQEFARDVLSGGEIRDYFHYHFFPFDLSAIQQPERPIFWEETQCIIDRYQVMVAMMQLQLVRDPKSSFMTNIINLLNRIDDPRLSKIHAFTNSHQTVASQRSICAQLSDKYTVGDYDNVSTSILNGVGAEAPDTLELAARAQTFLPIIQETQDSLLARIVNSTREVLLISENSPRALQTLKKLALTCATHPVAIHIAAFVGRAHSYVHVDSFSVAEKISAITGSADNPWLSAVSAYGPEFRL